MEVLYFANYFTNIGTQAAIIGGFLLNSLAQIPYVGPTPPYPCSMLHVYTFWVTIAIVFALTMHLLLISVFVTIYGQELALRGPLGSMVKAVDGMVKEQEQTVVIFATAMIFFAINMISSYFVMMSPLGAIYSSFITLIGIYVWKYYALRIYNRFKLDSVFAKSEWQTGKNMDDAIPENQRTLSSNLDNLSDIESYSDSIQFKVKGTFQDTWETRYVLIKKSLLFFYQDKDSFRDSPETPLRARPTALEDYRLIVHHNKEMTGFSLVPLDREDERGPLDFSCSPYALPGWVEIISKFVIGTEEEDFVQSEGSSTSPSPSSSPSPPSPSPSPLPLKRSIPTLPSSSPSPSPSPSVSPSPTHNTTRSQSSPKVSFGFSLLQKKANKQQKQQPQQQQQQQPPSPSPSPPQQQIDTLKDASSFPPPSIPSPDEQQTKSNVVFVD